MMKGSDNYKRTQLARDASIRAQQVRQQAKIHLTEPINVYDCADKFGISVHFVDTPSLEGMYNKHSKTIVVSALRPPGRQAFTCAHELGHHFFEHGTRLDELMDESAKNQAHPMEIIADSFAGFLLMPKTLIQHTFYSRGWCIETCTPLQFYTIAWWLGVGYMSLINHLTYTLRLMKPSQAKQLKRISPKEIRACLLGEHITEDIIVVDPFWLNRTIDIQIGDLIFAPADTVCEGDSICFECHHQSYAVFRGVAPGSSTRLFNPSTDWAAYVRVSRRNYTGRSIYRHLEDPDYDRDSY